MSLPAGCLLSLSHWPVDHTHTHTHTGRRTDGHRVDRTAAETETACHRRSSESSLQLLFRLSRRRRSISVRFINNITAGLPACCSSRCICRAVLSDVWSGPVSVGLAVQTRTDPESVRVYGIVVMLPVDRCISLCHPTVDPTSMSTAAASCCISRNSVVHRAGN